MSLCCAPAPMCRPSVEKHWWREIRAASIFSRWSHLSSSQVCLASYAFGFTLKNLTSNSLAKSGMAVCLFSWGNIYFEAAYKGHKSMPIQEEGLLQPCHCGRRQYSLGPLFKGGPNLVASLSEFKLGSPMRQAAIALVSERQPWWEVIAVTLNVP